MAGGQERILRRRIRSVQATKKITRAMELIAASQIVRAQNRISAAAPYQHAVADALGCVLADSPVAGGRLVGVPDAPEKVMVLAVVADRGLCGGYNFSVLRAAERMVAAGSSSGQQYRLVTVGRKAVSYLRFRGQPVERSFTGFSDRPSFADARQVASVLTESFTAGEVDQVLVVSTRFLSAGTQVVETRQLLPMPLGASVRHEEPENRPLGFTELEPDGPELIEDLLPRYVEAAVYGSLLEAAASEHTARQRAMAAATENADELTKTLRRVMNRARQDSVTTEIMEIVGGAEALRQMSQSIEEI
ncbi:MAG: ATP synthase F1 subunit gamma [Actinobacteria bacterium]|nr:ATP synthase F1 subunit gamma [Actinomycetota bacterium]